MKLTLLKISALALLRALAVQSNEDVPASVAALKDVASGAAHVTVEKNEALNGCLNACDRKRGGRGNNGWEACRAGCELDYGAGRRRDARDRVDDWDSDRARDRRSDKIDRRSDNRRQRRSDRRDRVDEYGTLSTFSSFDEDRARDRRDDRIDRRSDARKDRRSDARRRNGRPPVAPAEEKAKSKEDVPASDKEASSSDSNVFFPAEMNEEDRRRNRSTDDVFRGGDDDFRGAQKKNASQKRQDQRDRRRSIDNPDRSQREEQNERNRKHSQAKNRSNRCTDPSEPGCGKDNYPSNREAKRNVRCNRAGNSCNYHRSNPGAEPNRRRAVRDVECIDDCRARGRDRSVCDSICAAKAELAQE